MSALKTDPPTFVFFKENPQFEYIPDVVEDSGIKKCCEFVFSNSVYSVYIKRNDTQVCLVGEY